MIPDKTYLEGVEEPQESSKELLKMLKFHPRTPERSPEGPPNILQTIFELKKVCVTTVFVIDESSALRLGRSALEVNIGPKSDHP